MLGDKIKQKRIEKNLTQQDVANEFYVTRQTVSKWELNKSCPDMDTVVKLSEFFEIPLSKLVAEDVVMVIDDNEEKNKNKEVMKFKLVLKQDNLVDWLDEQKANGLVCVKARINLGLFLFEIDAEKAKKVEYRMEFFSYLSMKEKKDYFSTMTGNGWVLLTNEQQEGMLLFSSLGYMPQGDISQENKNKMKFYLKTNLINIGALLIALIAFFLEKESLNSTFSKILLVIVTLCVMSSVISYGQLFKIMKS